MTCIRHDYCAVVVMMPITYSCVGFCVARLNGVGYATCPDGQTS